MGASPTRPMIVRVEFRLHLRACLCSEALILRPGDSEICLKIEETLVYDRSNYGVQTDLQMRVKGRETNRTI